MMGVYIKEFLPNPVGKDRDGEYIRIANDSDGAVSLTGWIIKDAGGKQFSLTGYRIEGRSDLVLDYHTTKIFLNNKGETLFLYNAGGTLVDEVGYSGKATEGFIYAKEIILTKEIKEEFLEDSSAFTALASNNFPVTQSFLINLILTAAILTFAATYVIKKLITN